LNYFILCLILLGGAIIIAWGLYGWVKKDPGFFQGKKRRFEVEENKYLRYMGILTIAFGLCVAANGVLIFLFGAPVWITFILITIYLLLGEYGGKRYKVKEVQ